MRWVAAWLVVAGIATAHADGGPAMGLQIQLADDDPHSLYVMSNYGLMISHDDGCTFEWVCEPSIGYGDTYIPQMRVAPDGTIFATTFGGVRISRDGGCSFVTALAGMSIDGLDIGPTGDVWAATAENDTTNDVFVSRDNGQSFTPTGLPSSSIYWHSVRVASGDPTRVYATGFELGGAVHLRRRDGDSWVTLPVTDVTLGSRARLVIAAIAPHDPDVLYVVSEGAREPTGDLLYRSDDGGMTFSEVHGSEGLIGDVVVRDAQTVIVTAMVPGGPIVVPGPPAVSNDGGRTFAPLANAPTLACLTVRPDGTMLGCGTGWAPESMALTRFDGNGWTKLWQFAELSGPLACAPGTGGHEICDPQWNELDTNLSTSGPSCGPHVREVRPDRPPAPPAAETCCGASHHPTSFVWVLAVAWRLGRRRRQR